ncbi:(Fe-S)-binding protein [Clostridium sp. DL1XJH146]
MDKAQICQPVKENIYKEWDKCIDCKLCMKTCPMLNEFCNSPKELLGNIVETSKIEAIIPYSCNHCGLCMEVCPKSVDLPTVFHSLREEIVDNTMDVFKTINTTSVEFHQKNSFSKLFTTKVKKSTDRKKKTVFFPGCSLSSHSPDLVMKTYEYLKKHRDIDIMLKCCGNPTHTLGDNKKFNNYYDSLQNDFEKSNVSEVIVACENCYNSLKNNSPNIKVKSLYQEIAEIGIPSTYKETYNDLIFAIHDPCPTRYETIIHDSVREITKQMNLNIEELEYSREKTQCCGSGAMVAVTNNKIALTQMKERASEANSKYILTYCQECVESLTRGGKIGIHILDLLFNDKDLTDDLGLKEINTIHKWLNRYNTKRKIDALNK